jgi:hypothetical protein
MLANAASFVLIQGFRFNVCLEIFWIRNTGLKLPIEPGYVDRKSKFPSGQKTHPCFDINILPSMACGTMPLNFASDEA